jgi:hypothetical protein
MQIKRFIKDMNESAKIRLTDSDVVKKWEPTGLLARLEESKQLELANLLDEVAYDISKMIDPEDFDSYCTQTVLLPIATRLYRQNNLKISAEELLSLIYKTRHVYKKFIDQETTKHWDGEAEYCCYAQNFYKNYTLISSRINKIKWQTKSL